MSEKQLIIDAENAILGRLASYVAKKALEGEEVVVVNAERAVVSGRKKSILGVIQRKLETRTLGNVEKGPIHFRRPENYVRRVIRGMLPRKKPKGQNAFKRVKVYQGIPDEYQGKSIIEVEDADSSRLLCPYVKIEDLVKEIGGVKTR